MPPEALPVVTSSTIAASRGCTIERDVTYRSTPRLAANEGRVHRGPPLGRAALQSNARSARPGAAASLAESEGAMSMSGQAMATRASCQRKARSACGQ
jgi:hypothetical protein